MFKLHNLNSTPQSNLKSNLSNNDRKLKMAKLKQRQLIKSQNANLNSLRSKSRPIILYYSLNNKITNTTNQVVLDFIPFIASEGRYCGVTQMHMSDNKWNANNNIISFVGYRTPGDTSPSINLPPLYDEILNINIYNKTGNVLKHYISAKSLYIDGGSGFATTLAQNTYSVIATSGKFTGAKTVTIDFDNTAQTRTVSVNF